MPLAMIQYLKCLAIAFVSLVGGAVLWYLTIGTLTAIFFATVIGGADLPFLGGIVLTWPIWWLMGLIFYAAALGAPN